jgi:hypothetical protein
MKIPSRLGYATIIFAIVARGSNPCRFCLEDFACACAITFRSDLAEHCFALFKCAVEPDAVALRERPDFFCGPREWAIDDLDFAACWCFSCEFHFFVLFFGFVADVVSSTTNKIPSRLGYAIVIFIYFSPR